MSGFAAIAAVGGAMVKMTVRAHLPMFQLDQRVTFLIP
jgi:hypothetical protein